jgi:hypothetical protein
MSKIVFVLGAGASADDCGTPLMGNFLEVAEDLWRRGEVKEALSDFERVFKAIGNLQGIHSKARLDTYNIETIFASFEMGKLLNRLPGFVNIEDIEKLISSIKKVICYTLERTTKIPIDSEGGLITSRPYVKFANIVAQLIKEKRDCSIITFNYDLGLDYSLRRRQIPLNYCLDDSKLPEPNIKYLKLH